MRSFRDYCENILRLVEMFVRQNKQHSLLLDLLKLHENILMGEMNFCNFNEGANIQLRICWIS